MNICICFMPLDCLQLVHLSMLLILYFRHYKEKCSWHMPSNLRVSTESHMPFLVTQCVSHILGEFWRKWRFPSLHQLHRGQTYTLSAFSGQEVCFLIINNSVSVIFQEITGLDYKFIATDEGSICQRVMITLFSHSNLSRQLENGTFNVILEKLLLGTDTTLPYV
jgi:hypothetical protein